MNRNNNPFNRGSNNPFSSTNASLSNIGLRNPFSSNIYPLNSNSSKRSPIILLDKIGNKLISLNSNNQIKFWDVNTRSLLRTIDFSKSISSASLFMEINNDIWIAREDTEDKNVGSIRICRV